MISPIVLVLLSILFIVLTVIMVIEAVRVHRDQVAYYKEHDSVSIAFMAIYAVAAGVCLCLAYFIWPLARLINAG